MWSGPDQGDLRGGRALSELAIGPRPIAPDLAKRDGISRRYIRRLVVLAF